MTFSLPKKRKKDGYEDKEYLIRKSLVDKDFRASVDGMEVPTVTHEVGQYSVYPDLSEIAKYTGTLLPLNFMAVRNDLEKKGRLDKASAYLQASGKLAAILYKEEVERALKTPGISGFQLLDLHDFPGQGTALVGLLNAFWGEQGHHYRSRVPRVLFSGCSIAPFPESGLYE